MFEVFMLISIVAVVGIITYIYQVNKDDNDIDNWPNT